jgi:curved DNA-binding protein CbpA
VQTGSTHYDTLGVPPEATTAEIRACYVALARIHHPDFHVADEPAVQVEAAERMRDINEAWNVLGNRARREVYDRRLDRLKPRPATEATAAPRASAPGSSALAVTPDRAGTLTWVALALTLVLFAVGLVTGSSLLVIGGLACTALAGVVTLFGPRSRRGDPARAASAFTGHRKTA